MSVVVPHSQMSLCRSRRRLQKALDNKEWQSVGSLDSLLGDALASAADDPSRDPAVLLSELSQIIKLYRQLVLSCQAEVEQLASN